MSCLPQWEREPTLSGTSGLSQRRQEVRSRTSWWPAKNAPVTRTEEGGSLAGAPDRLINHSTAPKLKNFSIVSVNFFLKAVNSPPARADDPDQVAELCSDNHDGDGDGDGDDAGDDCVLEKKIVFPYSL